jgi:hypothetical protein
LEELVDECNKNFTLVKDDMKEFFLKKRPSVLLQVLPENEFSSKTLQKKIHTLLKETQDCN